MLAIVNVVVGGAAVPRATVDAAVAPRGWGRRRRRRSASSIVGSFVRGIAFRNPTIELIQAHGGDGLRRDRGRDRVGPGRQGRRHAADLGRRHVDDADHGRHEVHAAAAARPAARRRRAASTIAFGMGTAFRTALHRRRDRPTRWSSSRPCPRCSTGSTTTPTRCSANPTGQVIIADGRNHVELTDETYDFIVVDPPPPIESSGVSVISSLEFYQAAKARLNARRRDGAVGAVRPDARRVPRPRPVVPRGVRQRPRHRRAGRLRVLHDRVRRARGPRPGAIEAVLARPGVLEDVNSAPDSNQRTATTGWARSSASRGRAGDELRAVVGDGPLITDDRPLPEYFILRRLENPNAPRLTLDALRALLP